jgi:lipoprotein-anchoring transpeptidase ErfK/SrfK
MRLFKTIPAFLIATLWLTEEADARVRIYIDLSSQTMHVQSSRGNYSWPVSTARAGYVTPRGYYSARSMQRMHYSRRYDMSPMPHSIFFRGGYAIHGSYATGSLGSPASHGCVRLAPGNAALLYELVQAEGASIAITGSPPRASRYAGSQRHPGVRHTNSHKQETLSNPFELLFGN